tara:strand:- start:59 stop:322 length:264 start_codon:yes stop_codon:yes gene_type:complete
MPDLTEDDNLYIECYAVDEKNNIIVNNKDKDSGGNNLINNDKSLDLGNSIGIQALVGVSLMLMVYVIGDYIFKIVPNNTIKKKIYGV